MTANQNTSTSVSFDQDVALVQALLTDLQLEQTALIAADMDTIERMVDRRMELLQSLSAAAHKRYETLSAVGFEPNEKGMGDWLQQQSSKPLTQAWLAFQQQLMQAKELNRVNGLLITKHFQRNQERLEALQGNNQSSQIYGKNGQARGIASYRASLSV